MIIVKLISITRVTLSSDNHLYFWYRAFGASKQWSELASLAKNKKSLIGFGPFVDVCIEAGCKDEANR